MSVDIPAAKGLEVASKGRNHFAAGKEKVPFEKSKGRTPHPAGGGEKNKSLVDNEGGSCRRGSTAPNCEPRFQSGTRRVATKHPHLVHQE